MDSIEKALMQTRMIWAAIVMVASGAAGVFLVVARSAVIEPVTSLAAVLPKAVAVVAIACIVASRQVPRLIRMREAGTAANVHRSRVIVGSVLCEGPVLLGLVAYLMTRNAEALAVAAVPYLALLALFPTRAQVDEIEASFDGGGPA